MASHHVVLVALHVLGAALYVGGAFSILATNRALRKRLPDEERRDMVRHLGRAAAPVLLGGLALAIASGLLIWDSRGRPLSDVLGWKSAAALVALATTGAHVWLGRREGRHVALAALLGSATLLAALALVVLGAMMRYR